MAKKNRTFKVDDALVEIPVEEVDVFMQSVPDAVEIEPYVIGKDTVGIPLNEVEAFKASMPDAKPLYAEEAAVAEGQKKSPVGTSPEATGGFGQPSPEQELTFRQKAHLALGDLKKLAGTVEAAYPVAKNWVKSLFETEEKKPVAKPAPGEVSISEFDRNAIAKSVAEAPEQLRDSQDFKINWVNTYSKKTGVDKRAVMQIYDQANGARKTIDRLEAEYYGPAVPITPEGVPAPAVEKAPEEDPMQKFGKLYELARMYNFVGDHDRAEKAYFELERGLFDYGNAQMQNEDFRSRAPKNYIEQLQAPATQGLAYTKYLKGDKAGAKKIVGILETKGLLEKEPQLEQVGAGELVQPGMPTRKTTYGFAGKRGTEGKPTKESQYLNDIAGAIEQVSLIGPAGKMPVMGMAKIGKGLKGISEAQAAATAGLPKYAAVKGLESGLAVVTGVAETAAGVAGVTTPAGAVFALPFFQAQNSLPPEVSEWMMPVSKMVRNYYAEKGKEVPEWAENTAVLADFATLALLHQTATKGIEYGKTYNRARIMDNVLTDLSPEVKDAIFSDIEKNYKASGSDPVVYAEQVKEKLNSVKEEAEGLQADLKVTEPTPEYKPEPAPETLGQLKEGTEVEYDGQIGVIERGEDMSWNVNMGDGKVIELPTTDKTNPTEKLVDIGVNILPEVPKEQIAKAMADAEQTGKIEYKGKTYFVSLDRVNNPSPNGDFVVEIMPDGRMVDRFTRHPDPNFAAGRKLAITNAFLESKGLPKRSKNVEPWKEAERVETAEGIITFEPETPNATGGKGQYVLYDNLGEARVITEQEFNRLKEMKVEKAPAVEEAAVTAETVQPKVGDTVTIEPVKEGAESRKMVFTEEGWKQEVEGRQIKASTVAQEAAMKALAEKPAEAVGPIRELGTGAKVYFETEKYRVNEDLKTGDVLLNIEGREGPGAIANIRFDNPADAVKIAERINKDFPQGVPDALLIDKYVEGLKRELLGKPEVEAKPVVEEVKVPTPEEEAAMRAKEQERKQKNDLLDMTDKYNSLSKKEKPVIGANLLGKIREQAEAAGYDVTQGKQGKIVLRNKATGNKMIRPAREISPETKAELEKQKADNKRALSGTPIDFRHALLQVLLKGNTISWDSLGRILGYKSRAEYPKFVGSEKGMAIDQLWEMMRNDPDMAALIPDNDYDFGNMVADVISEFSDRGAMWDALKEYGKTKWKEMGFENQAQYEYTMEMQKALGEHGISIDELSPSEWQAALDMAEMADDATVDRMIKELDANFPETPEQLNKFYEDYGYERQTETPSPEAGRGRGIGEEAAKAAEEAPKVEPPPSMGEGLKNALDELKKAQDKFREDRDKLGVAFDPKKQAQSLYDLHQAYLKVAKEAIKEGVRKIEEFAKLVPAMTKGAAMAFEEALGRKAKLNITDFESGKLPKEYNESYTIKGKGIKAAIREATEMPIGKEYKDLVVRVKAEVKAAIDGYKAGRKEVKEQWTKAKEQNKEFADNINKAMEGLKGKVDPRTAQRLVKKALNATTPARMRAFEKFAEKAIMRANYLEDLGRANDLRSKLKNMIKGKDVKKKLGANNVAIIDQFSKIRPEDLESFDAYYDIAERLIESNKPMQYDKITGGVKRAERVIGNEEVANFLAEHQNKVEEQARADIRAEFQDLVDMGIIDPDTMTADDMLSIIDSIEKTDVPMTDQMLAELFDKQIAEIAARQELTPEMENKRLTLGQKVLKAFQDAAKYSQMNLEKYLVDEAPALTERQKQTINSLTEIDTSKLSKDQALLVNRTIQNIISNNSFAGADQVAGVISFNQKAVAEVQAATKGQPMRELGEISKIARSKELMLEKMTGTVALALKVKKASGIEQLWNDVAKMKNRFHDYFDNKKDPNSYLNLRDKLTKRDKIDYNSIRNRAIRGMYAKMIKNFGGTDIEVGAEFVRHKKQVYENIKSYLSAGGEVQYDALGYIKESADGRPVFIERATPSKRTLRLRQEGEFLLGIYNELFKDANNAGELRNKIYDNAKGNVELVDRAIEINRENRNDVFESAEMDQNKIDLDYQENYTRDKYKSSIDQPLSKESATEQLFNTVFSPRNVKDKASGSMNKVIRSDKAYQGRLLDFDFDNVFRDALHEDMFAASTARRINQIRELFRSKDANIVFGNEANARTFKKMLMRGIDIMRNERAPATDLQRNVVKLTGKIAYDASRLALLGGSQIFKQFVGVATGSIMSGGAANAPRMLKYFAKGFANMNHPMLNEFNISQRGTILGGFFTEPTTVITERGLVEKNVYDKVLDFREKIGEAIGKPLGAGDAGVARASWWMYYLDYLKKKGVDVDAIDFSTITPDYDAAAYAEQWVSRMQNANDRASMPELYASGDPFLKIMRDFALPFSSFSINMRMRMANDIDRLLHGPKEEKVEAYRAFQSSVAEQFVFNAMKVYVLGNITTTGANMAAEYFGISDEEKGKYKEVLTKEVKRTDSEKVFWNSLEDLAFGGLPAFVRTPGKQGFNAMYNAATGADEQFSNGPFFVYQTTQDPNFPVWIDYMGVYGTLGKTAYDLYDIGTDAITGETVGYKGAEMPLTEGERKAALMIGLIDFAGIAGVSDQDVTALNNKLKTKYRKHITGTYGGEIQIKVPKKPTTSASFLRASQDPAERAQKFIKVWNSPDITEEDKYELILQGVKDERTFTKKFGVELKKADRKIYNRYLLLKKQAQKED